MNSLNSRWTEKINIPGVINTNRYFQMLWVTYVRFSYFFLLWCYTCVLYMLTICLFLTDKKLSRVLVCSLIFYYSKNMDQKTVLLSFVYNMKLDVQRYLKCWLWLLASLLRAEHMDNNGITGLRNPEKMSMTMLFPASNMAVEVYKK